jgi:hypothetical protein
MSKKYFDILNQEGDFGELSLEEWISFLDDYYRGNTSLIDIIISTPKGESVYSYLLPIIDEQSQSIKGLFANATETLIKEYYQNNNNELLNLALDSIRFLELSINFSILKKIVLNDQVNSDIRSNAANTLSIVNENLLIPFWNEIDFTKNLFLIPSYITYFQNKAPVIGLSKLLMVVDTPDDLSEYETVLLNSLNNIFISKSDYSAYLTLYPKFPQWVKNLITDLFEDYPELNAIKNYINTPYKLDVIDKIETATKLNLSNVNFQELPLEIKKAWDRLISNLSIEPDGLNYFKNRKISIANFKFFDSFQEVQECLTNEVKTIFDKFNFQSIDIDWKVETFEISERSPIYYSVTGFTYPYYLDKKRQFVAGVIPYAYQQSMAIIIPKNNNQYKRWVELREEISSEESINNLFIAELMISENETVNWFIDLLKDMKDNEGKIHFIEGYIFDDVVSEFQNRHFLERNVDISLMNQEGTRIDLLNTLSFFNTIVARKENREKRKEFENSIFVLDPVEAFNENPQNQNLIKNIINRRDYDVINVRHGLKYPIGFGFSLYALPYLLVDHNWQKLMKIGLDGIEKIKKENAFALYELGWTDEVKSNKLVNI